MTVALMLAAALVAAGQLGNPGAAQTLPGSIQISLSPDPATVQAIYAITVTLLPGDHGIAPLSTLMVSAVHQETRQTVSAALVYKGRGEAPGSQTYTGQIALAPPGLWQLSVPIYAPTVPGSSVEIRVGPPPALTVPIANQ